MGIVDKKVLVIGLGLSGISTIKTLSSLKAEVYCYDDKEVSELQRVFEELKNFNYKFIKNYNDLKEMVINEQNKILFNQKIENLMEKYNSPLDERYNYILNKIVDEERLFIAKKDNNYIINGSYDAIEYLEIFKNIYFEEAEFYIFYVNYLSKKEDEDEKVLVGYNGVDGKEVTMSKLKEDINEIRDSRSMFKK